MINLEHMLENSYKNFHCRGLDYVCLSRTPEKTVKVYFFDCNVEAMPEVVNPHNHRYAFDTTVLDGVLIDQTYLPVESRFAKGEWFEMFNWRTPLNGGNGFEHVKPIKLAKYRHVGMVKGVSLRTPSHAIHTIKVGLCGTVIKITQYQDVFFEATQTFIRDKKVPNLSGLYERFTADELIARLRQVEKLL